MSGTIGGSSAASLYLQVAKNEPAEVKQFAGYDAATKTRSMIEWPAPV